MRTAHEVLRRPLVTEKTMALQPKNVYTFVVDLASNRDEVKRAVESIYSVKVDRVRLIRVKGKLKRMKNMILEGRRKDWKKAYVTLKEGFRLEII